MRKYQLLIFFTGEVVDCISSKWWAAQMLTEDGPPREMAGNDDPLDLNVIDQAAYVLRCFEKEMGAGRLVQLLRGEASLAQAYIIFFGQMGWIREGLPGRWRLTEKGKETIAFLLPKEKTQNEG